MVCVFCFCFHRRLLPPSRASQFSIDSDIVWGCGAAPEPVFDVEKNIDATYAFKTLLVAVGTLATFYQLIGMIPRENPAVARIERAAPVLAPEQQDE